MFLPTLNQLKQSKLTIDTFGGLCQREAVPAGSFSDMENMACDDYPVLSTRKKRGVGGTLRSLSGFAAGTDSLYWISDNILHIGKNEIELPPIKTNLYDTDKLTKGKYYVNGVLTQNPYLDSFEILSVSPGDKIDASSWKFTSQYSGAGGGVRVGLFQNGTWVRDLLTYDTVGKDYIEIPAGVNQIAVAYWADDKSRYLYNLTADGKKQEKREMVLMGANLFVFPDKVYVNTEAPEKKVEHMENAFEAKKGYRLRLFKVPFNFDGNKNTIHQANLYEPDNSKTLTGTVASSGVNGDVFVSVAQTPSVLYQVTGLKTHENGVKLETRKLSLTRVDNYYLLVAIQDDTGKECDLSFLSEGDYVEFKGLEGRLEPLNGWHCVEKVLMQKFSNAEEKKGVLLINAKLDNDSYSYNSAEDNIEFTRFDAAGFAIKRSTPDMEYVVGYQNRLWGCNSEKNEIYCSALGDFKNWRKYEETSISSYAASVGVAGIFTGACVQNGVPTFFKENTIFKIYGTRPQNFQILSYEQKGVEQGSGKSLCLIGGVCYYKAVDGVYAYDGNSVHRISGSLGDENFSRAIAGRQVDKYYISLFSENKMQRFLYCYDTSKGLWTKEDAARISAFANCREQLYFIEDDTLYSVGGRNDFTVANGIESVEDAFAWFAETGDLYEDSTDKKYISKLQLRLTVQGSVNISLQQDGGQWETVYRTVEKDKRTITVPILPRRCEYLRVRLEGRGACKLYALSMTSEKGSELNG